jgi:hypothetical protein
VGGHQHYLAVVCADRVLLGAVGPFGVDLLLDTTDGWTSAMWLLVVTALERHDSSSGDRNRTVGQTGSVR